MAEFFASKYPVTVGFKDGKNIKAPTGTIFTIDCISGNMFCLIPIKKTPDFSGPVMVDGNILRMGFTQQEQI